MAQSNISQFEVKFSANASDTTNSCRILMDRNNIYFYDDNGNQLPGVPFGAGTLLQNHQCAVYPWQSSLTLATAPGTTATLTLSMGFMGAYPVPSPSG